MIRRFRAVNYKALRDITLDLTPVHVLIGPNDSGKTSILEALAAVCRSVDQLLTDAFLGAWRSFDLVWQHDPSRMLEFEVQVEEDGTTFCYELSCRPTSAGRAMKVEAERLVHTGSEINLAEVRGHSGTRIWRTLVQGEAASEEIRGAAKLVHDGLSGVHFYRWTPDFLALPAAPDSNRRFRMEQSGFGLALCLDDILGYDPKRFLELERGFTDIFPECNVL